MPKYYEGQFLKFIGNALKENAVILTCMSAFSHIILMVNFATISFRMKIDKRL